MPLGFVSRGGERSVADPVESEPCLCVGRDSAAYSAFRVITCLRGLALRKEPWRGRSPSGIDVASSQERLDLLLRAPIIRPFQEFAVRIVDRPAVGAELALVAVHDDVEDLFERQAVFQGLGAAVDDDVA